MPVFELVVREGPDSGRVIPVEDGATLVLGRALDTDVHLEDAHVSRRHCRIEATGEHLRVTDLESANGTFIDGTAVDQGRLQPGQTLRVGPFVLECHLGEDTSREPSLLRVGDRDTETVVSRLESSSATAATEGDSGPVPAGRNLEVAYRLSRSLARTPDPARLLDRVIDEVFEVVDADQVAVLRPSDDGPLRPDALDPVAIRTRPGLSPREIVVSTSVVEEVLGEGVSILSTHALSDERFRDADSVVDQEIHSLLCAPLQTDAGPQGVLYADNRRGGGAFSEADLQLFS
ncbi:MAG: FHA domain-containing protein, partial [Gemmatimonadota bacterium]